MNEKIIKLTKKILAEQVDMYFETPWTSAFNVVKNEENAEHEKIKHHNVELNFEDDIEGDVI
jgi:hypothetical protein